MKKSDKEWRKNLTPEQYHILRQNGTEPAFSGKYYHHTENGEYLCAGCGTPLFASGHKYNSGSGWPSFYDVLSSNKVSCITDNSHGMERVEVRCSTCDSHLGHVFPDGPQDKTGLRYCINSASLVFKRG